jgi:carbon-monoxide dehydrogenase large subunit
MTAHTQPTTSEFGRARKRKEDARLITGRTRWTDNITLPGMLHLAMVRSPLAHAKITRINADAANQLPGVIAVYTGADLDAEQSGLPCVFPINAEATPPRHVSIASDTVRFAGEIVAVVIGP